MSPEYYHNDLKRDIAELRAVVYTSIDREKLIDAKLNLLLALNKFSPKAGPIIDVEVVVLP